MKRNIIASAFSLALVLSLAGFNSPAKAQVFTTFDADPHATFPSHIDSTGRIIGVTFSANQTYGGFVRNTDGSIINIDYPGALSTDWIGFAGSNQIAGSYTDSLYAEHGFLGPVSGPYTEFDYPGAKQTTPMAANSAGQVIGFWMDASSKLHGFLRNANGTFVNLTAPGATATNPLDINSSGQIAGYMTDASGVAHGFLRSASGAYTLFSLPAGTSVVLVHINDAGQIAGSYASNTYTWVSFLRDTNGTITSFTVGGAITTVDDINQGGYIVGAYGGKKNPHRRGFLRRPDGTIVSIEYPGADFIDSSTVAACINQAGTIAGRYQINTTSETETNGFILTGLH